MIRLGIVFAGVALMLQALFHLSDPPQYVVHDRDNFRPFYAAISYKGKAVEGFLIAGNDTQSVVHTCTDEYVLVPTESLRFAEDNCK